MKIIENITNRGEVKSDSNKRKQMPWLLLAAIILLLSVYMAYWGTQKEGFHIDEMFSVMDIRGEGLKRPYNEYDFFNTWHNAPDLESTAGVSKGSEFSETGDTKNLYRNLLHIAYSFQPGEFSLWPSLILNVLTLAGCLIVIYLLSRMFIENEYLALLPGIMWGLSSAAVNLVLFIRFYTFKTLICLLLTYAVFIAVKSGLSKRRYLYIAAVLLITGIGAFIHQYVFVYAFFLTAFVCIYLLLKKEIKTLLVFSGAMAAAAAAYQLLTGDGISRIFTGTGGSRVEETFIVFIEGNADFGLHIQAYGDILGRALFGGTGSAALPLLFIVPAIILCIAYVKDGASLLLLLRNAKVQLWIISAAVCTAYLLMIAYIAPYQEIRYVFCITPVMAVLFISLLLNTLTAVGFKSTAAVFAMVSVLSAVLPAGNVRSFNLHWDEVRPGETLAPYYHLPVVCISEEDYHAASCYPQLFEFEDKVLFALNGEIDSGVISDMAFDEGLILFYWYTGNDSDFYTVMDAAGLDAYRYITSLSRHNIYYLYR